MVFFDANKVKSTIEFDGPGIFIAGTPITGRVLLDVTESLTARSLVLKYEARQRFRENVPGQVADKDPGTGTQADINDPSNYDEMLHSVQYVLFGSRGDDPIVVHPGHYVYPFSIPTPDWLPASSAGEHVGEVHTCCTCCQCRCAYKCQFNGILHYLDATVIIANSLKDNVNIKPFKMVRGVKPAAATGSAPPPAETKLTAYDCVGCCPAFICGCCLGFCRRGDAIVQLKLLRPVVVPGDVHFGTVEFELSGVAESGLVDVVLIRETKIGRVVGSMIVANLAVHMRPNVPNVRGIHVPYGLVPSADWEDQYIRYYVSFDLDVNGGCCAATFANKRVKIPIQVFDVASPYAPSYPGLPEGPSFGGPAWGRPMGSGGSAAYLGGPLQHPPSHQPHHGTMATYGYVPPVGTADTAVLAGPVTEQLPAPVWGYVVDVDPLGASPSGGQQQHHQSPAPYQTAPDYDASAGVHPHRPNYDSRSSTGSAAPATAPVPTKQV